MRYNLLRFDNLPSTNTYLKENSENLPDMTAVTADFQTNGRGRMGNTWIADRGCLALSLLIKRSIKPTGLTLLCAVATARAIKQLCGEAVGIKWTNDIILADCKVCGILCEGKLYGDNSGYEYIICGIGLNVNQSREFFVNSSLPNAASLYTITGRKYDKEQAARLILDNISELLECDGEYVLKEYISLCITLGKRVRLIQNGNEIFARAVSVDNDGALICENDSGGLFRVTAGEVKLRAENGDYI